MPKYSSDSIETIREIFSLEGDAMHREGFSQPTDAKVLAEDQLPRIQSPEVVNGITEITGFVGETALAYGRYLLTGDEELAYE